MLTKKVVVSQSQTGKEQEEDISKSRERRLGPPQTLLSYQLSLQARVLRAANLRDTLLEPLAWLVFPEEREKCLEVNSFPWSRFLQRFTHKKKNFIESNEKEKCISQSKLTILHLSSDVVTD